MAFASDEFELDAPQEDGLPLREHLRAIERRTGQPHPAFANAAKLPEGCEALWNDYTVLRSTAQPGFSGPTRIEESSIYYFQRNRGFRFQPWELEAMRRADSAFIKHYADQRAKGGK